MTAPSIELRISAGGRRFLAPTHTEPSPRFPALDDQSVTVIVDEFVANLPRTGRDGRRILSLTRTGQDHAEPDYSYDALTLFPLFRRIKTLPLNASHTEAVTALEADARRLVTATARTQHPAELLDEYWPEPRRTELSELFAALRKIHHEATAIEAEHHRRRRLPVPVTKDARP